MFLVNQTAVYFHTHWDREWYLPFRQYQHRLVRVIDDILAQIQAQQLPCFTLDGQTVVLEDYLALRPEREQQIKDYIAAHKMSVGPWYVMPDEFLVSGESLIRNLQIGLQISEAFGETAFTGYLPDTFGHSADIPMLLQQFGIGHAIVWRGVQPQGVVFNWLSPSGDSVLTYHLTESYFQHLFHMGTQPNEGEQAYLTWRDKVQAKASGVPLLFPFGADHLGVVRDGFQRLQAVDAAIQPTFPSQFMAELTTLAKPEETYTGELRQDGRPYVLPGVYSARLYLKQWNRRLEWQLTRQLEPLCALLAWHEQPVLSPSEHQWLWKTLLLNHPHDSICGCSVDSVHRENESRFEQIDQYRRMVMAEAHHQLRQRYQPAGTALVVNLGDQPYTGVVSIRGQWNTAKPAPPCFDQAQTVSETTILDETYLTDTHQLPFSENQALDRESLIWVENLPPHSLTSLTEVKAPPVAVTVTPTQLDNGLISLTVEADGALTVTETTTGKTWPNLHRLRRNVEQGDSYNAASVPGQPVTWASLVATQIVETGPLRSSLKLTTVFADIEMPIETLISLEAGSTALWFETTYTNQAPDHKIQACFAQSEPITTVEAEGHFAPITRTYDPAYRIAEHMPAPKQLELLVQSGPIQRWITCQDQTLATEGLCEYEVEGNQLQLTLLRAFGMLSRNDTGVRGSHAGPPLPTPEGQCLHRPQSYRYAWSPHCDLSQRYALADKLYGAQYGFDRLEALPLQPTQTSHTWLSLTSPNVMVSAVTQDTQGETQIRLLNPTNTPQSTQISLGDLGTASEWREINLRGEAKGIFRLDHSFIINPYQLLTIATRPAGGAHS